MTQEQKDLLVKDLCARLPYKIKCSCRGGSAKLTIDYINKENPFKDDFIVHIEEYPQPKFEIEYVKPYLRPMSSMTEREKEEFEHITGGKIVEGGIVQNSLCIKFATVNVIEDWLNAHHFDFRGLIPMDLAIAVTKGNNPYN